MPLKALRICGTIEKDIYERGEIDLKDVYTGNEAYKKAPKLKAIPTSIPGLDPLFYIVQSEDKKTVKRPLKGIPAYSALNITGVSDTGKSLMVEQFAVKQASENKVVIFVTVETPVDFTAAYLAFKATAM